jgi:hypothetical protein
MRIDYSLYTILKIACRIDDLFSENEENKSSILQAIFKIVYNQFAM